MVATREIAPGEELFADYGKRYRPPPYPTLPPTARPTVWRGQSCTAPARVPAPPCAAPPPFNDDDPSQHTRNLSGTPPRRSLRGAEAATGWPRGSRDSRPPRSTERRAGGADAALRRASRAARRPRRAACAQCTRASVCPAFAPPTCAPPRVRARSPAPWRPRGQARRLTCRRLRRSPLPAPAPAPSPRQPRPRAPPAHHEHRLTPPAGLRLSPSARRPRGAAQGRAGRCLLGAAAAEVELILVPLQRTECLNGSNATECLNGSNGIVRRKRSGCKSGCATGDGRGGARQTTAEGAVLSAALILTGCPKISQEMQRSNFLREGLGSRRRRGGPAAPPARTAPPPSWPPRSPGRCLSWPASHPAFGPPAARSRARKHGHVHTRNHGHDHAHGEKRA